MSNYISNFYKSTISILILSTSVLSKIAPQPVRKPAIAQPLNDLIDKLFVQKGTHFDIILYGGYFFEATDVIDEFPSLTGLKYAEKIIVTSPSWNHIMSKSAILFFPHLRFFMKFSLQVKLQRLYHNPLRFIVYCANMQVNDLQMISKPFYLNMSPGQITLYEYFLIQSQIGLELITFEWFTETECNYPMIISMNFFNTNLMRWKNELIIPEKFRNFHGCMLTIGVTVGRMHTALDEKNRPAGPSIDLFKAMATLGNFTWNYQLMVNDMYRGMVGVPRNGRIIDIQIYFQVPRVAFSRITDIMHLTTPFIEERVSFVLTEAEPYSSYEKLLLPFDTLTWIFCLTIFLCAFTCIFVINLTSPSMQNLVYGQKVTTPALNVIGIYFGSSQIKLPFENFPRIILVTFILFCLVLRTAYQGVLFEMVAGDMRKPLPKVIDDLYKMNYTISVGEDLEESLNETISFERSYQKILRLYQNHFPTSGGFLKEDLYSFISGFMMFHFHFLFELTDVTVQALITGGIIQHSFAMEEFSMNHAIYAESITVLNTKQKPKVLTVDDLSYGFTLWLVALMITLIVFLLELTAFHLGMRSYKILRHRVCKKV
ncbi:unnamed protein product [Chironomus riparius]|uniref:Ionotropic receptor n=1 Tax=Chironomus riparius TaxID=315576 RepID=A0A9N9S0E5_9DIPT|nr:unnamed protein product [Chironomus riparius]